MNVLKNKKFDLRYPEYCAPMTAWIMAIITEFIPINLENKIIIILLISIFIKKTNYTRIIFGFFVSLIILYVFFKTKEEIIKINGLSYVSFLFGISYIFYNFTSFMKLLFAVEKKNDH